MKDEARALLNALGLAQRAGKLKSGEAAVQDALKKGHARVVIMDGDASVGAKKRYAQQCAAAGVPFGEAPAGVGGAIGKQGRMVCALTDEGFTNVVNKLAGIK